ncbi:MAG: response regulator transcription factor [Bdellovibrionales bacterium]|nr:response regulator transcription factor [Bdellovibrionales bacterium]
MRGILVVEDSPEYQLLIRRALAPLGHPLHFAASVAEARSAVGDGRFVLVVLDVGLPDGDGFTLCQEFKSDPRLNDAPFIFLTGKQEASDVVTGFSLGAEDFIAKPFHPVALRARVEYRLKRRVAQDDGKIVLEIGGILVDLSEMRARRKDDGREFPLTRTEFKILYQLAKNVDRVLSRERILELVWGTEVKVIDRTVDTHVSALRRKIAGCGIAIEPVSGEGYRLGLLPSAGSKAA